MLPTFDVPGMPGAQMGMINLNEMLGKALGQQSKPKRMTVAESYEVLDAEESDKLLDQDKVTGRGDHARWNRTASSSSTRSTRSPLAPSIAWAAMSRARACSATCCRSSKGTTVATKHGPIKTDHILFIASGAFHLSKPSDMLPELQGRLPIRVELKPLDRDDFVRILTEPENSLIKQYVALLATEEVTLDFSQEAIDEIATLAAEINRNVENIGARRLQTVLERLLEDISFTATDRAGDSIAIDRDYVQEQVGELAKDADLSRFIL